MNSAEPSRQMGMAYEMFKTHKNYTQHKNSEPSSDSRLLGVIKVL